MKSSYMYRFKLPQLGCGQQPLCEVQSAVRLSRCASFALFRSVNCETLLRGRSSGERRERPAIFVSDDRKQQRLCVPNWQKKGHNRKKARAVSNHHLALAFSRGSLP